MKKKLFFKVMTLVAIIVLSACSTREKSNNDMSDINQNEENIEQQIPILSENENQEMIASMEKDSVTIQVFAPENVKIVPGIVEYDFESACERGEIKNIRGTLPGLGEGTWFIITVDGVEFYYARYDETPDKTELFEYAIISSNYSLENGISVGMTKSEVIEVYPAMAILDTEGTNLNEVVGHMGWNHTAYPHSPIGMDTEWNYVDYEDYYWARQFDYIMLADVEQTQDSLPIYMALMMKDDKVAAITFYCPTAN